MASMTESAGSKAGVLSLSQSFEGSDIRAHISILQSVGRERLSELPDL
jgi:hypothetical protein